MAARPWGNKNWRLSPLPSTPTHFDRNRGVDGADRSGKDWTGDVDDGMGVGDGARAGAGAGAGVGEGGVAG